MPHTKSQKLISWKVLDRYKTSRGIEALLRKHKIAGTPGDGIRCPLAIATGYMVGTWRRAKGDCLGKRLTKAETEFVIKFDSHDYPSLERK